jgi:hypothetical protein
MVYIVGHWGPPNYNFMVDQFEAMESNLKALENNGLDQQTIDKLDPVTHLDQFSIVLHQRAEPLITYAGSDWLEDAERIWRAYK